MVASGRLRDAAGGERPGVRVLGLPGRHRPIECLGGDRCPRARLLAREPLLDGHRAARDRRCRGGPDPGDRLPPQDLGADPELRGVPRLLAAPLLQQRGRHRRVLGLPREAGGHGPLAAAQVGGPGPRRRDADAEHRHPQHPQAGGGSGRLHGAVQRDRRHDRRRHRVPAGPGQLPLRRRRRVRRHLDAPGGRPPRAEGVDQAHHRPAAQHRRPGPAEPRGAGGVRVDAAVPAGAGGAQVVPLPGGADRRL